MNNKKVSVIVIIFLNLVAILLIGLTIFGNQRQEVGHEKYVQKQIPTVFVHGWGSSYHAQEHMVQAAKSAGISNISVRVDVDKNNHLRYFGRLPKYAKNPLIEVNIPDTQAASFSSIKAVAKSLRTRYGYKKINFVGHSYGNILIAQYILHEGQNKNYPQVNKWVSIAGHFNGYLGESIGREARIKNKTTGQPDIYSATYNKLFGLRKNFPRNTEVLNIYGNKEDGTNSDGSVSVASARSLKYLLNGRAKSYQEKEIKGSQAQHSKLHENKEVDHLLINFLWKK